PPSGWPYCNGSRRGGNEKAARDSAAECRVASSSVHSRGGSVAEDEVHRPAEIVQVLALDDRELDRGADLGPLAELVADAGAQRQDVVAVDVRGAEVEQILPLEVEVVGVTVLGVVDPVH